ncbi:MAG: L-rhamnose mutarotase [Spirochaetia bacterium]
MKRHAFRMKLNPGCASEYKKHHDEIWPELIRELEKAGISDYSIYLDEETNTLFGFQKLTDHNTSPILKSGS